MEFTDASRQVDEIINLQDQWFAKDGAVKIKTPALFSRLQKMLSQSNGNSGRLEVKKCLAFEIDCSILYPDHLQNLKLEIEFPFDYPSSSICRVKTINTLDGQESTACTAAIWKYLDTFRGCECVEMLLDWIEDNKSTCLKSLESGTSEDNKSSNGADGMVQCHILRYNHLLSGPEHRKEKAMISAAKKSRLQGGLLFGTPGVVVIVPPSNLEDAQEYASECRTIGKRPDGPISIWLPQSGLDDAGMGGMAQQKRGGKLKELDTAGLRCGCGGNESLLKEILGVH